MVHIFIGIRVLRATGSVSKLLEEIRGVELCDRPCSPVLRILLRVVKDPPPKLLWPRTAHTPSAHYHIAICDSPGLVKDEERGPGYCLYSAGAFSE